MFFTVSQSRTASLSPPPYVVILISCSGLVSFVLLLLTCLCCKRGGVGFNVSLQHVRDSLVSYSPRMFTLENYTNTVHEVNVGSNCLTPSERPMSCTCPGSLLLAHFSLNHLGWFWFFTCFCGPTRNLTMQMERTALEGPVPFKRTVCLHAPHSLRSTPSQSGTGPTVLTWRMEQVPTRPQSKRGLPPELLIWIHSWSSYWCSAEWKLVHRCWGANWVLLIGGWF